MSDEIEQLFPRPLMGGPVEPLPPALVPSRSPMVGNHVVLEPMNAALHGAALYEASHTTDEGRAIWTYLPQGPWPDEAAYTAHLRANSSDLSKVYVALRPSSEESVCGQASYMDIEAQSGVIEIGYIWFGPQMQRTRAATEALYLMINHAMTDLGYRRMQWRCNSLNAKSRGAARRLGFRFEGIFHNHMVYKGLNRDTAWYSILDDEWPEVKSILEAWLDDANFDAEGVAKTSLLSQMQARGPSRRGQGQ